MALSWEWKLFLLNMTCQSLFAIYTSLTLFIALRVTLPQVYRDDAITLFNRTLLAVILATYVVGNYICIKLKFHFSVFSRQQNTFLAKDNSSNCDSNWNYNRKKTFKTFSKTENEESDSGGALGSGRIFSNGKDRHHQLKGNTALNLAGWDECRQCNELTPPRSKHCPLCRSCILKRDHHCFFAGCCIGFHNQRYFTTFCLYGALGALYSTFATVWFINENYELFQEWGVIAYFPPFLIGFWVLGYTCGTSVLFVLFLYWSTFTACLCLYFFLFQMFLVVRGQTKYEFKRNRFLYSSDLVRNLMSVFGPSKLYCLVSFLVPLPFFGYLGDGKTWDELFHGTKGA